MSGGERYRLVRTIASGGMAQVYEAVASGHGGFARRVAVKRMLPQFAHDLSMRRMFLDEANIASRLHHGNIVQVLDYGVVDGSEFIVMEFIDGIDALRALERARREGSAIEAGVALHIAAEIAHALHYAHTRCDEQGAPLGIVHRDVSPQNVLLSWDGDVKLSDFGIALAAHREEKTSTGVVKGKARYMAPEQAEGKRVTAAADVFALGRTLRAFFEPEEPEPDVAALIDECVVVDPGARPAAEDVAARAGRLAAARLTRDGRGALRQWLARLKPGGEKASALDDVMGLCLVPGTEAREYSVVRVADDHAPRVPEDSPETVARPRTKRRWIAWAAAGAIAAAAAFGVGVRLSRDDPRAGEPLEATSRAPQPADAEPPMASPETRAITTHVMTTPVTTTRASTSPDAPAPPVAPPPASAPPRRAAGAIRPAPAPRDDEATSPPPPPSEPLPASDVSAVIAIGGRSFVNARVTVDGQDERFAPTRVRRAPGKHRIVITNPSTGEILFDEEVVLGEHHTPAAPLQIRRD